MGSLFIGDECLPMRPGGVGLKPTLGLRSKLKTGAKIAGKKAKKKPERKNEGKPRSGISHRGPKPNINRARRCSYSC